MTACVSAIPTNETNTATAILAPTVVYILSSVDTIVTNIQNNKTETRKYGKTTTASCC